MNVNDALNKGTPMKAFIYGYGKTRKTSWAGLIAKTNLNGIYCDCDNSVPVLGSLLTPEEQAKLAYIDISDGVMTPCAVWFVAALTKGKPFIWDLDDRKVLKSANLNHNLLLCNPNKFTRHDCLILDSYTQICNSMFMQYAIENNIDVTEAEKIEWDNYRWAGQLCTQMLTSLLGLKCSVIVIGHVKTYEKKRKDKFGKEVVVSNRTQPLSVSNPHAETISKFFGEVLYFFKQGTATKISTKTSDELDCGSRYFQPKDWNFDELSVEELANRYNINKPSKCSAISYFTANSSQSDFDSLWNEIKAAPSSPSPVSSATKPSANIISGNRNLISK